jgi:hypothetical protein
MSASDMNYFEDMPDEPQGEYFNPDVYQALNQITEEIDSYDNYVNRQLFQRANGLKKQIDKLDKFALPPVPPKENTILEMCDPNKPFNAACCTIYCDNLSPFADPEMCQKYCSGDVIIGDICCLVIQVSPAVVCERLEGLTRQCGPYRIVCEVGEGFQYKRL